jgi:pimeloyl-ACP methyl ester carboxylesterase
VSVHFVETPARDGAPTLVFVHGAGSNHTYWGLQLRDLRDAARAVALDLPGHGKSAPAAPSSIAIHADAVEEVVRSVGAARVGLVGHSMGGAIALELALRRPEWLAGLALVGAGAKLRVTNPILFGLQADFAGTCRQIVNWSVAPQCPAEIRARALADLSACPPDVVLADFRACHVFDVRDRVGEIGVPTLVLCGTADQMTPPKFSEFLAEKIPGSTLTVVPGAGHMVAIERPDVVNAALRRWLATLS